MISNYFARKCTRAPFPPLRPFFAQDVCRLFYVLTCLFLLQEWVTATDLRISLDRLNTFGDEIFGDVQVLQSYWYAIADVAVGARCKCNGHASICNTIDMLDGTKTRSCK